MNTRNGKIARLPRPVREELNKRLERSEPGPQLLEWLNALKEVREIVKKDFAGIPVSKQNLSEWRQGGFQEWIVRQDLWAGVRNVEHFARELGEERDNVVADDVATVLAARYAALISRWDGEVDGKFEAGARVLNGLCRGVVQLQRGMHQAAGNKREHIQELEAKSERLNEDCKKRLLNQVWAIQREPMVAEVFGGGKLGRKLAKYVVALENDMPNAKLEIADEGLEKSKRRRKKQVKPISERRTAKRIRKTKPANTANPLEQSDVEQQQEPESAPEESSPVKPGQTDLVPEDGSVSTSPIGPMSPIRPTSPDQDSESGGLPDTRQI